MAAITIDRTSLPTGIQLSGSPIILHLNIGTNTMDIRKKAVVSLFYNHDEEKDLVTKYELDITSNSFDIDIHDAVDGWFIGKQYNNSSIENLKKSVCVCNFSLSIDYKAKRDYGNALLTVTEHCDDWNFQALEGRLTEYIIHKYDAVNRDTFADPFEYSLKPFSMEAVNHEEVPYPRTARPYYAEDFKNHFRHRVWFINSLGMLESASLLARESESIKYSTINFSLQKRMTFNPSASRYTKKNSTSQIKMSSGYCTQEWCEWWANEFAFSNRVWIECNDGTLLPVAIEISEAQEYNKASSSLGSVQFAVRW